MTHSAALGKQPSRDAINGERGEEIDEEPCPHVVQGDEPAVVDFALVRVHVRLRLVEVTSSVYYCTGLGLVEVTSSVCYCTGLGLVEVTSSVCYCTGLGLVEVTLSVYYCTGLGLVEVTSSVCYCTGLGLVEVTSSAYYCTGLGLVVVTSSVCYCTGLGLVEVTSSVYFQACGLVEVTSSVNSQAVQNDRMMSSEKKTSCAISNPHHGSPGGGEHIKGEAVRHGDDTVHDQKHYPHVPDLLGPPIWIDLHTKGLRVNKKRALATTARLRTNVKKISLTQHRAPERQ